MDLSLVSAREYDSSAASVIRSIGNPNGCQVELHP